LERVMLDRGGDIAERSVDVTDVEVEPLERTLEAPAVCDPIVPPYAEDRQRRGRRRFLNPRRAERAEGSFETHDVQAERRPQRRAGPAQRVEPVRDLCDRLLDGRADRSRERERLLAEADVAHDVARAFALDVVGRKPYVMSAVEVIEAVDAGDADTLLEVDVVLEPNLRAEAAVRRIEADAGCELGERLAADPILEAGGLIELSRGVPRQHREGDDQRNRCGDGSAPALRVAENEEPAPHLTGAFRRAAMRSHEAK